MNNEFRPKRVFEKLEDRILFDAVPDGNFLNPPHEETVVQVHQHVEDIVSKQASSVELVVIDAGVEDAGTLIESFLTQNPDREFQISMLNSHSDGFDQVQGLLEVSNERFSAVHILSHGSQGVLNLGNSQLSLGNFSEHASQLELWSAQLHPQSEILIYGCQFAGSDSGHELLHSIAHITGLDIAASDDVTGAESLGGDWDLEVRLGDIQTETLQAQPWQNALDAAVQDWAPSLDTDSDQDGISDLDDLDDDNDGILDVNERVNWSQVDVTQYLTLGGNASADTLAAPNEVLLTPAADGQLGTALSNYRIDLTRSFVLDFDMYHGDKDGADGIAFVLHDDPNGKNANGSGGYALGAAGITNGLGFEFDTYKNLLDMAEDHTSVWDLDSGQANGTQYIDSPDYLIDPTALENLENGQWHNVKVSWDASAQKLSYSVNQQVIGTIEGDIATDYFGGSDKVYFGWTASTGSANNEHAVRVNDFIVRWEDGQFENFDSDGDGLVDSLDNDSDNDGISDLKESGNADAIAADVDGDGVLSLDETVDSDGDGILDIFEASDLGSNIGTVATDADADGIADYQDLDSDNDGFADTSNSDQLVIIEGSSVQIDNFDSEENTFDASRFTNEYGESVSTSDISVVDDGLGNAKLIIGSQQEIVLTGVSPESVDQDFLVQAGFTDGRLPLKIYDSNVDVASNQTTFVTLQPEQLNPEDGEVLRITAVNGQAIALGETYVLANGVTLRMISETQFSVAGSDATEGMVAVTVTMQGASETTADSVLTIQVTPEKQGTVVIGSADTFIVTTDDLVSEGTVLLNDIDVDGDYIGVTHVNGVDIFSGPVITSSGALITMGSDGTFDYDQNNAFDSLPPGQIATDTFTYTVADSDGTDEVTVTMEIHSVLPTFPTDGSTYQVHSSQGQLVTVDTVNKTLVNAQYQAKVKLNAVGLNTFDHYAYGFNQKDKTLVQIGSNGQYIDLGPVDGMPEPNKGSYVGDFGPDGLLYVRPTSDITKLYGIDVYTQTVTNTIELSTSLSKVYDIAWNPSEQLFYSIRKGNQNSNDVLLAIDLNGTVTQLGDSGIGPNTFGAMFADGNGDVFGIANKTGYVYQFDTDTGLATKVGEANKASINDGFSNPNEVMNLAPLASDDRFEIDRYYAKSGNLFDDNGFGIDLDGNGDQFQITSIDGNSEYLGTQLTLPSGALLTIESDGSFNYDPNGRFDGLYGGQSNIDSVTYTIEDAAGFPSTATVNFVVSVEKVIIWDLNLAEVDLTNMGDVNGNGYDDFAVSLPEWDSHRGVTFLIHGSAQGIDLTYDVNDLLPANGGNGSEGTIFYGIDTDDLSGETLAVAGDVNADGYSDFLIGASDADNGSELNAGESYLLLGRLGGFGAEFNLEDLMAVHGGDGTDGAIYRGMLENDLSGNNFIDIGDFNGDGFDDFGIGVAHADVDGRVNAGQTFVVYGSQSFEAETSLQTIATGDGSTGFAVNGVRKHDLSGESLQAADINGDGLDDIVIGATFADANGIVDSGQTYVIYGSASTNGSVELSDLAGENLAGIDGLVLNGTSRRSGDGASVQVIADVNQDGILDFSADVKQNDGSFLNQTILNRPGADSLELTDSSAAVVRLDKLNLPEDYDGRVWDQLADNITLHSSDDTSVTIWGNRHVVTVVDGFKEWFDIGFGSGEITLESGATLRWQSNESLDPGTDEYLPLNSFEIDKNSSADSVTINDGLNVFDQVTLLSETDLREFAWALKRYAGDRDQPLTLA
ncbi:MAG: DUF4347 domain-containing protein [Planctomycetota bacterium]